MTPSLQDVRRRAWPDDGRYDAKTAAALSIGLVAIASVVAVLLPGPQNDPGRLIWYKRLHKPRATPPDPVFGLAWPVIEAFMAFAGWRLLQAKASPRRTLALGLLAFNLSQIPGYTALFFGAKNITGALASATALVAGAWAYVAAAWTVDRPAALAGLPLAGWTSFAEYLMIEIERRND